MRRCPPHVFRAVTIAAALVVALISVNAFAQMQSGNIFGHVQAKDGSMLPGVTVTLSGIGAPQTFVTDATGAFRCTPRWRPLPRPVDTPLRSRS